MHGCDKCAIFYMMYTLLVQAGCFYVFRVWLSHKLQVLLVKRNIYAVQ